MKPYLFILIFLASAFSANAQYQIKGQVLSMEDRQPVPGALLRLNGSDTRTTTDNNGNFQLMCSGDTCVLEVFAISYITQSVKVSRADVPLTILLRADNISLPEVIVSTGYQRAPKERITGSFSHIDNKSFNQQVSTDVTSRLEALAGGLSVNRSTGRSGRISIRGMSSIQGPKDVLIVLDNFPYEGDLNNINPNDVEDITILKDAAAASIWGSKAGNGVIVITTKKGKFNQPLTAELNTNFSIGEKPDLSYLRPMSSSDFIDVEQMLFGRGYYTSQINSASRPVLSPVVELLRSRATASPSQVAAIDQQINSLRTADVRNDFDQYIYQPAYKQQYSLNLRGGSDLLAWTASGGHDRNTDNQDAGFNRLNLRFQNTLRPFKKLELSSGIYYSQTESSSGSPGVGEVGAKDSYLFPYAQFADEAGNSLPIVKSWRQSFLETAGNGKRLDWRYFPLEDYKHSTSRTSLSDILVNAGLNYTIWDGFTADLKYTFERQNTGSRSLNDQESYFAREMVNIYSQVNGSTITYKLPKGGILDQSDGILRSNNLRMQLNYNHTWNLHDLALIGGSELRRANSIGNRSRYYGYNDNTLSRGLVDLTTMFPHFITGSNIQIPDNSSLEDTRNNFMSYFANAAYTYRGRYSVSLSGRRDASNLFGLRTNDQWNPFWSAGLSWTVSDEKFLFLRLTPLPKDTWKLWVQRQYRCLHGCRYHDWLCRHKHVHKLPFCTLYKLL